MQPQSLKIWIARSTMLKCQWNSRQQDLWIDVDLISILCESVGSITNRRWFETLCHMRLVWIWQNGFVWEPVARCAHLQWVNKQPFTTSWSNKRLGIRQGGVFMPAPDRVIAPVASWLTLPSFAKFRKIPTAILSLSKSTKDRKPEKLGRRHF